jgi:DNA-binding NarL/FixJ family response regulator
MPPVEAVVRSVARASVLVVDDHALLRTGVANIISQEPDLYVIVKRSTRTTGTGLTSRCSISGCP